MLRSLIAFECLAYDDGRTQLLLCIHGLLPIAFRSASYNIPIALWLPLEYPTEPPLPYVVPTSDMLVKSSASIDLSGRCSLDYTAHWARKPDVRPIPKTRSHAAQHPFDASPTPDRRAHSLLSWTLCKLCSLRNRPYTQSHLHRSRRLLSHRQVCSFPLRPRIQVTCVIHHSCSRCLARHRNRPVSLARRTVRLAPLQTVQARQRPTDHHRRNRMSCPPGHRRRRWARHLLPPAISTLDPV